MGEKLIAFVLVVKNCKSIIDVSIIYKMFVDSFEKQSFVISDKNVRSFEQKASNINIPLAEAIEICSNALYAGELTPPPFPRAAVVELMQTATSSVEFSFNNIMHRQIDGVAMGSPLGPSLANIFVGYYEALLCFRIL